MHSSRDALITKRLTKRFGGLTAVNSVDLAFRRGNVTALIGPNGAGKTTVFELICGELKPDGGRVSFFGEDITGLASWAVARKGLGRLFQDVRVFEDLTVMDNILIAQQKPNEESLLSSLRPFSRGSGDDAREEAMKWLRFVGLEGHVRSLAGELSFGQQKLLALARLLVGGYRFMLLDEPTAGLHPEMIAKVMELLSTLVREHGVSIALVEHDMSVVMKIADWVYFMNEGEIFCFGTPEDVLAASSVRDIYLGDE